MNEQKPQQPARQSAERTPIPVEKLIFSLPNPGGANLPSGTEGKNERYVPHLMAGEQGEVKIEIDHRPWQRVFRVTKLRRVTHTEGVKEVVSWAPMGRPFTIPETWAVAILADE